MTYHIELETRARREYLKLPPHIVERLTDVIDDLPHNPRPPGCKKLTGKEGYRVRSGDYRILYTIRDTARIVQIYRIAHRRDVYRK